MKKIVFILIGLVLLSCTKDGEGSIIGAASANDGAIVEGITVKVYDLDTKLVNQTTTDGEGNFSITGLDSGNYYVAATITVDGEVWDTDNTPIMVYVSGEIVKEVALSLVKKE